MRRKLCLISFALLVSGCADIQSYWQAATAPKNDVTVIAADNRWWQQFNDPLMDQLADQLLAQNIDIKIAQARVDEARGQVRVASSSWFPQISRIGNAKRGTDQVFLTTPRTIASGGFDATWEIDIFGSTRTRVSSADALEIAASASVEDVQNSVLAELVKTVVEWHQARQVVKETNDLLVAQEDQVKLLNSRAKAGLIDASFKERAQAEYAQTATQLPLSQAALEGAEYKIEKLLGKSSGELHVFLNSQPTKELNVPPADKVLELTIDSIRQRPDVRASKAQMLAAQSNLDAAEADLWPRLTIGGFLGMQANSSQIPSGDNPIWSISSGITSPILNFGRLHGAVDSADARARQAELTYENTTLGALQEAKTALSDYLNGINAVSRQAEALKHRRDAVQLAKKRFLRGLTDMTDLTTAQAELDQATLALINQKAATAIAFIRLQKAMGVAFRQ